MAATAIVEAHIDQDLKTEAEKILAEEGLTFTDVIRALLIRTVRDQSTPHDLFIPNAETVAAMEAARRGDLIHAGTLEQLMVDLHADD